MIGLIAKVLLAFVVLAGVTLAGLDAAGVASPGTISWRPPDAGPCRRALAAQRPEYVHVRWVWHAHAYGWGCFYELEDGSTNTIAPMPR